MSDTNVVDIGPIVGGVGICPKCGKLYSDVVFHECKQTVPEPTPGAWICPKCGYVWAWYVSGCENCNQLKTQVRTTSGTWPDYPETSGSGG